MSTPAKLENLKSSEMLSEYNYSAFKKIIDFVTCLRDTFCSDGAFHEIALYAHLLMKTNPLTNKNAVMRHLHNFTEFVKRNNAAILSRDYKQLMSQRIIYSNKVFIDFKTLFETADKETTKTMWDHLLVISATLVPDNGSRDILRKLKETGSSESNFVGNILTKLDNSIDKTALSQDPASTISSICQSGIFNDVMSSVATGINSGQLNMNNLLNVVQQMASGLQTSSQSSPSAPSTPNAVQMPDMSQLFSMVGSVVTMLQGNNTSGMSAANPLQFLGSSLGTMQSGLNPDTIKDQIEKQVAAELEKETSSAVIEEIEEKN